MMSNLPQPVTTAIPHFSEKELRCKGSGEIRIDPRFVNKLINLRNDWGRPLIVSSFCRSPAHNRAVAGHPRSLHLTKPFWEKLSGTAAADIRWGWWPESTKLEFARLAYKKGLSVGLHDIFCHIDLRTAAGLAQVVFLYGTWVGFSPSEVSK